MVDGVLGLWPNKWEIEHEDVDNERVPELVELLIDIRNEARRDKQFARADQIRDELEEQGIELHDAPGKTSYEIKNG